MAYKQAKERENHQHNQNFVKKEKRESTTIRFHACFAIQRDQNSASLTIAPRKKDIAC